MFTALTRTHNMKAGSVWIGTKENPSAAVNFARKLVTDNLNRHGSNENWRACERHRPAGEQERRPPVSLLCFDTQLFVGARELITGRASGRESV
ncbi:unnamed protein product [Colias eurytheme]|nr:unnamed protein product [Colias eurytheme]